MWQATQLVGSFRLGALGLWQLSHFAVACLPRKTKCASLPWSKVVSFQSLAVWQFAHFWPKVPLCLSSFLWQEKQSLGASLYFLDL